MTDHPGLPCQRGDSKNEPFGADVSSLSADTLCLKLSHMASPPAPRANLFTRGHGACLWSCFRVCLKAGVLAQGVRADEGNSHCQNRGLLVAQQEEALVGWWWWFGEEGGVV